MTNRELVPRRGTLAALRAAFRPSIDFGVVDHVADAFRAPRYLVNLKFAQRQFTVAIDSIEAHNNTEAERVALKRAKGAFDDLGNLILAICLPDTDHNRKLLGVDGAEFEPVVTYSPLWREVT